MASHRVLITGVGGNIGQGVIKSLRAGKRAYHIVGIDMEPLSAGFSFADSYYVTPRTSSPEFKAAFSRIAEQERIEAVYVCSPTELNFFSRNKDALEHEHGLKVFVNPPEVVETGNNKLKTALFLKQKGFPYPETCLAEDRRGIDSLVREYGFPVILKPIDGFSSNHIFIANSMQEIDAANRLINNLVVQRYISSPNHEFTAGTISGADKKVRAVILLHRHLIQGTTYRTELTTDENLSRQIIRVVERLGAVGPCNVQFRIEDGKVYVFEINPRFSGSCGIRYLYGFNDCELMFELFKLGIDIKQPVLKQAVVLRYWNEICYQNENFLSLPKVNVRGKGLEMTIKSTC